MSLLVPLQVHRRPVDGKEHLVIWHDGQQDVIKSPVRPYFISRVPLQFPECNDEVEESTVKLKPLSTLEEETWHRYSFSEVAYISQLNSQLKGKKEEKELINENHCPYVERVAIDEPDFLLQYPANIKSHITLDIETWTHDHQRSSEIISIAVGDGTGTIEVFHADPHKSGHPSLESEKRVLQSFIDYWIERDPDVVVGYNHKNFDLPIIVERCQAHGLPTGWINRPDKREDHKQALKRLITKLDREDDGRINRLRGRVAFDVWEMVDSDQTLFGIKSRGLKDVAEWFGIPTVREDLSDTQALLYDKDRLIKYNTSDVFATEALYQVYRHQLETTANILKFPYDAIVNPGRGKQASSAGRAREGISTLIGRLMTGRGMAERGYCEDGQNRWRYFDVYSQTQGKPYQGAIVSIEQTGVFSPTHHFDVSGMYPNIQISVNGSPETVRILQFEDYDTSVPMVRSREKGKYTVYCIPDKNIMGGKNVVIWVDQSVEGAMPALLRELGEYRGTLKPKEEEAEERGDKDAKTKYRSMQYGIKVVMNACGYGSNAPAEVRYGNFALAVLITGIGRHILQLACDFITDKFGLQIIERDTDGVYFSPTVNPLVELATRYKGRPIGEVVLKEINDYLNDQVSSWGRTSTIKMDYTYYERSYFYRMKSYILDKKGDGKNLKFMGVAFKSSGKPGVFDKVKKGLAKLKLDDAPEPEVRAYIKSIMRIDTWGVRELTMRRTISRLPHQYKNRNDLGARLALLAEDLLNIEPKPYNQYEYVHMMKGATSNEGKALESNGYGLAKTATHEHLNYKKYRGMLADLCSLFGYGAIAKPYINNPGLTPVDGWF